MKTVTIESVNYKIVEYTKKCKYIKTILVTFRIDNKDYEVTITNLEKSTFYFTVPFCNKPFGIASFKYLDDKSKFYEIEFLCRGYTNYTFEVGTYKDTMINEDIERFILEELNKYRKVTEISDEIYQDAFSWIKFKSNKEFETYKVNLINYYASQIRKNKLSNLDIISKLQS